MKLYKHQASANQQATNRPPLIRIQAPIRLPPLSCGNAAKNITEVGLHSIRLCRTPQAVLKEEFCETFSDSQQDSRAKLPEQAEQLNQPLMSELVNDTYGMGAQKAGTEKASEMKAASNDKRGTTGRPNFDGIVAAGVIFYAYHPQKRELFVLMVHQLGKKTFPGGKVKAIDGSLLETAAREVEEETHNQISAGFVKAIISMEKAVNIKDSKFLVFMAHLPDHWDLPDRIQRRLDSEGPHPEAKKVDGASWVALFGPQSETLNAPHAKNVVKWTQKQLASIRNEFKATYSHVHRKDRKSNGVPGRSSVEREEREEGEEEEESQLVEKVQKPADHDDSDQQEAATSSLTTQMNGLNLESTESQVVPSDANTGQCENKHIRDWQEAKLRSNGGDEEDDNIAANDSDIDTEGSDSFDSMEEPDVEDQAAEVASLTTKQKQGTRPPMLWPQGVPLSSLKQPINVTVIGSSSSGANKELQD